MDQHAEFAATLRVAAESVSLALDALEDAAGAAPNRVAAGIVKNWRAALAEFYAGSDSSPVGLRHLAEWAEADARYLSSLAGLREAPAPTTD